MLILLLIGLNKKMNDIELKQKVQEIKFRQFQSDIKYMGVRRILESLKVESYHVDNKKVAKVIKELDLKGAVERGKRFIPHEKIKRGKYEAPGAAHVMYSDINEKLKKYKLYL